MFKIKIKKLEAPDIQLKSTMVERTKATGNGMAYTIGAGLKVEDNTLSVDTAKDYTGDNTRPVEAAFMRSEIGNIEILLKTI